LMRAPWWAVAGAMLMVGGRLVWQSFGRLPLGVGDADEKRPPQG
jgi:hypothetical protein